MTNNYFEFCSILERSGIVFEVDETSRDCDYVNFKIDGKPLTLVFDKGTSTLTDFDTEE